MKKIFLILLLTYIYAALLAESVNKNEPSLPSEEKINEALQNLPAIFRKNMGQWEEQILYRGLPTTRISPF